MKPKPKPATAATETPTALSELDWLAPLVEEGHRAYAEIAAQEDQITALRREDKFAPCVARAREPVAQARTVLPLLKAYEAGSAQIRAEGEALGLDVGPHSLVAESGAGALIRQWEEAGRTYDDLASGRFRGDPDAALAEILIKVKGAETALPAKRDKLTALVARIKDVKAARGIRGLAPEGPPVLMPDPRGHAEVRQAVTEFNPLERTW